MRSRPCAPRKTPGPASSSSATRTAAARSEEHTLNSSHANLVTLSLHDALPIFLNTTLDENLRMIADSVGCCRAAGREVFYDAEHFFDGFYHNRDYALQTLRAAQDAGASVIILCDTNGGR